MTRIFNYSLILTTICLSFAWAVSPSNVFADDKANLGASSNECMLPIEGELPADLASALTETLIFLAQIKGNASTALHLEYFASHVRGADGHVSGETYCAFLRKRIMHIKFVAQPIHHLIMTQYDDSTRTLGITERFKDFDLVFRAATLIHEANHLHKFGHVPCKENPYEIANENDKFLSQELCDDSIEGSYSVEAIWLKNVALYCENCSALQKSEAMTGFKKVINRVNPPVNEQVLNDK